jgi:hypothetical protein
MPGYQYSRTELLRILRLTARQLEAWEKAELVATAESYSFFDLLQIKKVRDLYAQKVRPAVIRQSLEAMRKQAGGSEPVAGQFIFDFSERGSGQLPTPKDNSVASDFSVTFDSELSQEQVKATLEALANYYRACGGIGFDIEFEFEDYARKEALKSA